MNPIPPPVPPGFSTTPEKKSSCMPAFGVGCLVLLVVGVIGIIFGVKWVWGKTKEKMAEAGVSMEDFQQHPERATAKIFLSVNPDVELVSEDKEAGTMTVKMKSSGETITVTYKDLAAGKLVFRNESGEVIQVNGKDKNGTIVVEGKDGKTVIGAGAEVSQPPSWVPLHPSMSIMQGGMKTESATGVKGTCLAESTETIPTLRTFYEEQLKNSGFNSKATVSDGDNSAMMSGENSANKSSLTIMLSKGEGTKTTVMIHYGGPK